MASGITLFQLAAQLVKLRSLLGEIKDVPPRIETFTTDLGIAIPFLHRLEEVQARVTVDAAPADPTLKIALESCRTCSQELADMIASLEKKVNSSKKRTKFLTSMKVVLSDGIFEKLERKLERLDRLKTTAFQLFMIINFDPHKLESGSGRMKQPEAPPSADYPSQDPADCPEDRDHASSRTAKDRQEPGSGDKWRTLPRSWRYRFPGLSIGLRWTSGTYHALICSPLIASSAWELQFSRATSGWQIFIRSHPVRPRDSQPFVYVRDGNLTGLLQCFDRSEATPFDKDMFGWSLIHHAALSQKTDICKKLLDLGVDVNERTNSLETCLRCFSSNTYGTLPEQDCINFTRLLLSRGAEIECYTDEPQDEQLGALYEGTAGSFSLLQSHLFPRYYNDDLTARLQCALRFALNPWSPAEQFRVSLHQRGKITREDIKKSEECHLPILNIALLGLSIRLQRRAAVEDLPNWQSLVSLALSRSQVALGLAPLPVLDTAYIKSACSGQISMATPLFCVIIGSLKAVGHLDGRWKMGVEKSVQSWVETVKGAGMDIDRYGRAEQSDLLSEYPSNYFHRGRKIWARGLARLERVDIGSEVKDWDLLWNERISGNQSQGDGFASTDELGGMPGSWVEDIPAGCCC